jgi:hypothetical protein
MSDARASYNDDMESNGDGHRNGVPAWTGPLLIGVAVAAAASFFGAMQGVNSQMGQNSIQLATLKASFDAFCERVMERVNEVETTNKRQDRELQQIRSHLRLPPP